MSKQVIKLVAQTNGSFIVTHNNKTVYVPNKSTLNKLLTQLSK